MVVATRGLIDSFFANRGTNYGAPVSVFGLRRINMQGDVKIPA